ncbi:MAG: CheR family methyltransferase [Myxococcales bacterium]|nr:protein-glutamate O-methyltransferase CheR [Polyangiaceae bacterium]MDW8248475.1 CheR family methyltransferase [Myxococcales bacterium]
MSHQWRSGGPRMDPQDLAALLQIFREAAGLEFPRDTEYVLERKLQDRLVALRFDNFGDYVRLLRSTAGRKELEHALDEVTTHETYFFREEYQLRLFQQDLLPRLRAMNEGRRRLTLWSAGCASGEEAYTVAMLLDNSKLFEGWALRVVGSDLSKRCIYQARRGSYGRSSFRALPREFEERYFTLQGERLEVIPKIREMCLFLQMNLLDQERHLTLGRMDAIFCRNVLIYLAEEARQKVLRLLYERLIPGGYLMLGHSESLLHLQSAFEAVHLQGDVVYRRPESDDGRRSQNSGRSR